MWRLARRQGFFNLFDPDIATAQLGMQLVDSLAEVHTGYLFCRVRSEYGRRGTRRYAPLNGRIQGNEILSITPKYDKDVFHA